MGEKGLLGQGSRSKTQGQKESSPRSVGENGSRAGGLPQGSLEVSQGTHHGQRLAFSL